MRQRPDQRAHPPYLKTSDVAQAVGVHTNTVRLFEEWGYLPPIPRSRSGYRLFTPAHVEQMKLARLALQWPYPGGKQLVVDLVQRAAQGDFGMAMEHAYHHLAFVRMEITYAEAAIEFLERWAHGQILDTTPGQRRSAETARWLGATVDQLRNWERNGLIEVPREPTSGYRVYGAAEIGRLRVIRMLRQSGYSLMAILRMLQRLDAGDTEHLRQALDSPPPDDDIQTAADRWLSTLAETEGRAQATIRQLAHMIDLAQNRDA
jgi:DNA-binding transcriptional MerR regulator